MRELIQQTGYNIHSAHITTPKNAWDSYKHTCIEMLNETTWLVVWVSMAFSTQVGYVMQSSILWTSPKRGKVGRVVARMASGIKSWGGMHCWVLLLSSVWLLQLSQLAVIQRDARAGEFQQSTSGH